MVKKASVIENVEKGKIKQIYLCNPRSLLLCICLMHIQIKSKLTALLKLAYFT